MKQPTAYIGLPGDTPKRAPRTTAPLMQDRWRRTAELPLETAKRPNPICVLCLSRLCEHVERVPAPKISPRQAQILRLLAGGLANKEIAAQLGIQEGTVRSYLSNTILPMLGLTSRLECALWARDHAELLSS